MPKKNLKKEEPLSDNDLHTEFVNVFKKLEAIQDTTVKQDILRRIVHIVDNPDADDTAASKIENTGTSDAPAMDSGNIYDILGHVSQDVINDLQAFFSTKMHLQMFSTPKENLEALRSIIPKTSIINNSKLANRLTIDSDMVSGDIIPVRVSSKKAKKEMKILATMAFENPNVSITGRQPYTAYDRAVYEAICSLWEAGNTAFTPAMVYHAMNGTSGTDDGGASISLQAIESVTRSIEKHRFTRLTIDCSEQIEKGQYKDLKSAKYDAMMISVDGIEMKAQNGKKVKAYSFTNPKRPPVLYEYSKTIGQVLSVPAKLLNSSHMIRSTDENIVIRKYLIRRIELMKGKNGLQSKHITYTGVCEELGIDIDSLTGNAKKDTHKRIRKNTGALLSHLQHENYIKGYEEYKDGRTVVGVKIAL